jgi:hypothetical protein
VAEGRLEHRTQVVFVVYEKQSLAGHTHRIAPEAVSWVRPA